MALCPAIRTIKLSKAFHHYEVLREISFEVAPGEGFALFGPNGAGKTTTLKILATLARPSSGRFEILGFDGLRDTARVRAAIFLIAHGSYHYDDLTAVENLRFAAGLRGRRPADREIRLALDRVGLGAFASLRVRHYSMGMTRRLALAKAILVRPQVLLLDEPYDALDDDGVAMTNDYLREALKAGSAAVFTTHNRARAAEVVDRIGVLRQGALHEVPAREWTAAKG